jgi:hypothetical protein
MPSSEEDKIQDDTSVVTIHPEYSVPENNSFNKSSPGMLVPPPPPPKPQNLAKLQIKRTQCLSVSEVTDSTAMSTLDLDDLTVNTLDSFVGRGNLSTLIKKQIDGTLSKHLPPSDQSNDISCYHRSMTSPIDSNTRSGRKRSSFRRSLSASVKQGASVPISIDLPEEPSGTERMLLPAAEAKDSKIHKAIPQIQSVVFSNNGASLYPPPPPRHPSRSSNSCVTEPVTSFRRIPVPPPPPPRRH